MQKYLSTSAVAKLLQVTSTTVANWIDRGKLNAAKTAGGHRRISVPNLLDFLRRQNFPIPEDLLHTTTKILVVDDEPAVATWIADEISAELPGVEVLVAHNGFAAGDLVGSQKPSLVILDIRMPGIDGFEVCRRIKAKPGPDTPDVIAITAYASEETEKKMLDCGARACLQKPLDRDRLLHEVVAALAG